MIYSAYQAFSDMFEPFRWMAMMAGGRLDQQLPNADSLQFRNLSAAYQLIERGRLTHTRPAFDIGTVEVGNRMVEVHEEAAARTPFATLLHFKKDVDTAQPRVLLVSPMSGHFSTLLTNTVKTLLRDHDVYITDWHNARNVPAAAGPFDLDEFVEHLIQFLEVIGPGAHIVAVCQPCVATVAAVAVMAEGRNPAQPASMTLMAGPIDTRIHPTKVNELAKSKPIEWFEKNLISPVPMGLPGTGRPVYPGFLQLIAFLSMNMQRHIKAHTDLYRHLVDGETEKAQTIKTFYDEYFAVSDLPAEFYLTTVRTVFQEHALPLGQFEYRGQKIDPAAIRRTALLTVEGERDDICAVGQTLAAHDLCTGIRPYLKRHHLQTGVGHYGVFSGNRWNNQIYPIIKNMILANN